VLAIGERHHAAAALHAHHTAGEHFGRGFGNDVRRTSVGKTKVGEAGLDPAVPTQRGKRKDCVIGKGILIWQRKDLLVTECPPSTEAATRAEGMTNGTTKRAQAHDTHR
jgi:hypothetical protein